jgi:hypothetical protein
MTGPYNDKKWNMQCEKLVEYKRKTGDCVVPQSYKVDKSLGVWVNKQRTFCMNNKLRLDRKERLDEIGFAWKSDGGNNPDDKLWHQRYEKLVEFKRINGDCMVPHKHKQDKSLGIWVSTQRKHHANDKIRPDRQDLLDEIGFAWKSDGAHKNKADDGLWHQRYEKLVEFKRMNGNCKVPNKYKQDKSLGTWVTRQRKYHNNDTIRLDRKELLDEIGFVWKAVTGPARSSSATDVRNLH